jgi:site-specific DNA-adenine methylase
MTLQPLIKHPGGKRAVADVVADLLGNPAEVCGLFAGGLGVSLTAGIRPAVTAEAIRALPKSLDASTFKAMRRRFNADGAADPALYVGLNVWCYNGLARFQGGRFTTAAGRASNGNPLVRPSFKGQRAAYARRFEAASASPTGGQRSTQRRHALPILAEPPYLNTFSYSRTWGIGDLCELADALPVGTPVCERIQSEPPSR